MAARTDSAEDAAQAAPWSVALLEVGHLTPALLVADRCVKAAAVRIAGIESADPNQCIKLLGRTSDVQAAAEAGMALAQRMGTQASYSLLPAPEGALEPLIRTTPVFNPLLGIYDARLVQEDAMTTSEAIGLLETQGLVAALHATDTMLKAASVKLLGKEKIGAAYVTIIVRGDVAAVQAAIEAGKATVAQLGGKLILADVIARPHPELAALLPGG